MRRFKDAHLPLTLDPTVAAYWPGIDTASASTVPDRTASATFHLTVPAAIAAGVWYSPFNDSSATQGSYYTAGGSWLAGVSSSSLAAVFAGCGWSIGMWLGAVYNANTAAIFEFAYGPAPAADSQLRTFGLYKNDDHLLTWGWDPSTGTTHVYNSNVTSPNQFHVGLTKEVSAACTLNAKITLFVDGKVVALDESGLWGPAGSGTSAKFTLKGSFRLGTSTTSPAFSGESYPLYDDVVLFNTNVPVEKMRELARNGRRNWNERRLYDGKHVAGRGRVLVEDGDGNFVDLSKYYGTNFVQSIKYKNDVETDRQTANVNLLRYRGERLNLSPLDEVAVNNLNAAGSYESLLEYRRRIKIEYAVFPERLPVNEPWMWETLLDGFVDEISWGADSVELGVVDRIAPLNDQFQIDPKFYAYGELSSTLAETHLQTLINNNVPNIRVSGTAMTFGYKGGTPTVYTPASSGWVLRYDDSQAAEVSKLLQSVADQIGWSVRYRWDQEQQQDRLTFRRPNRQMSLEVAAISHSGSQYWIRTTTPHNLTVEQIVTVSGTVSNNFVGNRVEQIPAYNTIVADGNTSGISTTTETVGTMGYGPVYTLTDEHVQKFDDIRKDGNSIRNAVLVKHSRSPSTVTLPITELYNDGTGDNYVQIKISGSAASPGILDTLRGLFNEEGLTFTVSGSSVEKFNVTDHIGQMIPVSSGVWIYGVNSVGGVSTIDTNRGVFASDYIRSKEIVAVDTPSISKYGYRPVSIAEAGNSNINTDREAWNLAQNVLSDLAEPTASVKVTIPFAPWFELDDYISLAADKKRRWSGTLSTAVTGVEHTIENGHCYTELTLRNTRPSMGNAWVDRIRVGDLVPALPSRYPGPELAQTIISNFQNRLGHRLGGRIQSMRSGGPREMRRLFTELHIGNSSTFAMSHTTKAGMGPVGGDVQTAYDPSGNFLRPGSTYFIKYRDVDVFGNPEPDRYAATLATSQVVRFNDAQAIAWAYAVNSSSVNFSTGGWNPIPFNHVGSRDPLGLWTLSASSLGLISIMDGSGVCQAYFRAPGEGVVNVEARLGFTGTTYYKSNFTIALGIFRLGSNIGVSSHTIPIIAKTNGPTEQRNMATLMYMAPGDVTLSHTTCFATIVGTISVFSGDYVQVGVFPDWGSGFGGVSTAGLYLAHAATTSSRTVSYCRLHFVQN
jgi:hypothetical protein